MANYSENRKAHRDYEIMDTYEVGIELLGFEVKSVRTGGMTLDGSYAIVRGGEIYLVGASIRPYQQNNVSPDYVPDMNRRLLLSKKEIQELSALESKKGLTIVPISVYNKGSKVKVSLAVVRGKRQFDKREDIKKRDSNREILRTLKNQY